MIDWRAEICRLLDVSSQISDEDLFEAIELAAQNLKELESLKSIMTEKVAPPRCQIIHSVRCHAARSRSLLYLEQPWAVEEDTNVHLRGSNTINNFDLFLERNKDIAFIVYKDYECCGDLPPAFRKGKIDRGLEIDASAFIVGENIELISDDLKIALETLSSKAFQGMPHPFLKEEEYPNIEYPYLFLFHRRKEVEELIAEQPPNAQTYLDVFFNYILSHMAEEWAIVDHSLTEKKIFAKYIHYLFVPNQIVLTKRKDMDIAQVKAYILRDWLQRSSRRQRLSRYGSIPTAPVYSWEFDGNFYKSFSDLSIEDLPSETDNFLITDMSVYPIEFASQEIVTALRKRGNMFWKCRTRHYVSYSGKAENAMQSSMDSRFMIDISTYKQMHRNEGKETEQESTDRENFPFQHSFEHNSKLEDDFILCLPPSIAGFNMQTKEWITLNVHYIEDVVWNIEAFEFLVIDQETKDMIKAVVTNQVRASQNTDLIRGKGNGLFILLHGGPGTGKTLTAESVAEIAHKPLYRVTCGDIGTSAQDVENYLEIVLHLGKTWGCVVLLDEADVFLQQRSLYNLERNALVSVFLRVLEYYDGILILTSNRVGIFDEAFKSRIQLSLRYKSLDRDQRLQIWKNFLKRLEQLEAERLDTDTRGEKKDSTALGDGINIDEIRGKVEELANEDMNGRQIRNTISTARQLAMYQQKRLGYEHIQAVISEAKKFDEYLLELNKGFSADEIQRDKKER
ncbi:P-loop containing nucleoside triphosphate hydrolase protein [Trichoderma velutinum]